MRTKRGKGVGGWFRDHLVAIICIVTALVVAGGSIAWIALSTDTYVKQTNAQTEQLKAEADKIAKEADERRAKEAAKAEAKRVEAAKELAEQSKTGKAGDIDASICNASKTHNNPSSIDVVVNKKHCMQPLNYSPADLTTVYSATLSAKAAGSFKQMYDAAAAEGQPFYVTSSYRSYATQISTYNRWVATSGQAEADTYSARPGYSEHQTGFAFDVAANGCTLDCFGRTSQYQWFQKNAAKYGFIQRYYAGSESVTGYKAEEWHYRYVGVEVAQDMQRKGIKTLEQYWNIPGGGY